MDEMTKLKMEIQILYNKIEALKEVIQQFARCEDEWELTSLKEKLRKI